MHAPSQLLALPKMIPTTPEPCTTSCPSTHQDKGPDKGDARTIQAFVKGGMSEHLWALNKMSRMCALMHANSRSADAIKQAVVQEDMTHKTQAARQQ
jgi:hypothetical protein